MWLISLLPRPEVGLRARANYSLWRRTIEWPLITPRNQVECNILPISQNKRSPGMKCVFQVPDHTSVQAFGIVTTLDIPNVIVIKQHSNYLLFFCKLSHNFQVLLPWKSTLFSWSWFSYWSGAIPVTFCLADWVRLWSSPRIDSCLFGKVGWLLTNTEATEY